MVVGDKGLNRGPSMGVKGDVDEKGPVVEVEVVTGDSVSEPFSRGRLSLRSKLSTLALLERLWAGLSVISASTGGGKRG